MRRGPPTPTKPSTYRGRPRAPPSATPRTRRPTYASEYVSGTASGTATGYAEDEASTYVTTEITLPPQTDQTTVSETVTIPGQTQSQTVSETVTLPGQTQSRHVSEDVWVEGKEVTQEVDVEVVIPAYTSAEVTEQEPLVRHYRDVLSTAFPILSEAPFEALPDPPEDSDIPSEPEQYLQLIEDQDDEDEDEDEDDSTNPYKDALDHMEDNNYFDLTPDEAAKLRTELYMAWLDSLSISIEARQLMENEAGAVTPPRRSPATPSQPRRSSGSWSDRSCGSAENYTTHHEPGGAYRLRPLHHRSVPRRGGGGDAGGVQPAPQHLHPHRRHPGGLQPGLGRLRPHVGRAGEPPTPGEGPRALSSEPSPAWCGCSAKGLMVLLVDSTTVLLPTR